MIGTLETERSIYVALFGIGLLTGVYTMLLGSVRLGQDQSAVRTPPAGFNAPVVAGALVAFGAVGYITGIYAHLSTIATGVIALVAAVVGWIGMTTLMAKWALKGPIIDPHEELEELQGTIATVTKPIVPGTPGEIVYVFRGKQLRVAAQDIGGGVVGVGTEVVIEKIEGGVADVELWSAVEQRL
jgi:hypothetical protein